MSFHIQPLGLKTPRFVSPKIRAFAKGQTCTLRLPCCNGNPSTTVHAHIRAFSNAGVGIKPHDIHGVHACSACHDALDRRNAATAGLWGFEDVLRAMMETQARLLNAGLIEAREEPK